MYVITAATRSMPNLSPPSTACHSPLHLECVPVEVPNCWHIHAPVCMGPCQQACTFAAQPPPGVQRALSSTTCGSGVLRESPTLLAQPSPTCVAPACKQLAGNAAAVLLPAGEQGGVRLDARRSRIPASSNDHSITGKQELCRVCCDFMQSRAGFRAIPARWMCSKQWSCAASSSQAVCSL